MRSLNALEHAAVESANGFGSGRIQPLVLQALPQRLRNGQRRLRADAGADTQPARVSERLTKELPGTIEHRVARFHRGGKRAMTVGHRRPEIVLGKQESRTGGKIAGASRTVAPTAARSAGPAARVAEPHGAVRVHVLRQPDPHERFRADAALRITVETDPVHPQFHHLR